MRARLFVAAALVVALATMSAASISTAIAPDRPGPLDAAAFQLIAETDLADATATLDEPAVSPDPAPIIADFVYPIRSVAPRPAPVLAVAPNVVVAATPRPAQGDSGGGNARVSGSASWYCKTGVSVCHHSYPGGMYAAAGSEIRIGNWRGRTVKVCGNGRCIFVKLIDWCACGGPRVIDLYSDAFRQLAPLGQGTLKVTVSW